MDKNNDWLFKSVWNNIVIFRNIYKHVKLFKKNECVQFNKIKSLIEYPERDYIKSIIYKDNIVLKNGDLPTNGVLKEVKLAQKELYLVKGSSIPFGVEIIEFNGSVRNRTVSTTPLSSFPPTVHTVNNVVLISSDLDKDDLKIPSNITSISFIIFPNLSSKSIIPNTIKSFRIHMTWNNNNKPIFNSNFQYGLTSLSIIGCNIKNIEKCVLPNSIKELEIGCIINDNDIDVFNGIPTSVEKLYLKCQGVITPKSNLVSHTSIKILKISYSSFDTKIEPYSLPTSITDLNLLYIPSTISHGTIPNSVTNLELCYFGFDSESNLIDSSLPDSILSLKINQLIKSSNILPQSLTNLEFFCIDCSYLSNAITTMFLILPKSLTSITLPEIARPFIPYSTTTIKNIKFKE